MIVELQRPNWSWLKAIESFVVQIIRYLKDWNLYADWGGPIILLQIENELGEGYDHHNKVKSDDRNYSDDEGSINNNHNHGKNDYDTANGVVKRINVVS